MYAQRNINKANSELKKRLGNKAKPVNLTDEEANSILSKMEQINNMPEGRAKDIKLGEVMQESAKAALSYVRSRASALGLADDFYEKIDIHIHVPAGAIPKDGPSAGTALATALTSALTKRPIYKDVAMTGEITLRGRVLPIGGLKEKLIAAHRGGITKALVPKENEKDLEEIPKSVLKELKVICVEHMDEVLHHALVWNEPPQEEKVQF